MNPALCLGDFKDVFQLVLENPWNKMHVVKKKNSKPHMLYQNKFKN